LHTLLTWFWQRTTYRSTTGVVVACVCDSHLALPYQGSPIGALDLFAGHSSFFHSTAYALAMTATLFGDIWANFRKKNFAPIYD
jgi:hypothetical protein